MGPLGPEMGSDIPGDGSNPWEVDLSSDENRIFMSPPRPADVSSSRQVENRT